MKNSLRAILLLATHAAILGAQPAVPVEPVAAIVEAFRTHRVVALGEGGHGDLQGHAFRLALVRDPRFQAAVNDIVVEFGSARYQDVMDRFVRGEDVPQETLRQVWQNTTQPDTIWDSPIYEEFFRAVRAANASLPRGRQLRVILGDPPIDWAEVRQEADIAKWNRDGHAVDVIRREVIDKGRRALVIYGDLHFLRNGGGIAGQLLKAGVTVLSIHTETRVDLNTLQPGVSAWPKPSFAMIKGTPLGTVDFGAYYPGSNPLRMEEQFDSVLYLAPPTAITTAQLSRTLCGDRGYMEMRLARMSLVPPPPGAPFKPVDRLKDFCALPEGNTEIPDREPKITEMLRATIRDAAAGKVDPERIAPESRDRLTAFLQNIGPRFLGPSGALETLTLLVDTTIEGKRVRRYRSRFSSGRKILWTVGLSADGLIVSLDPRPE